MAEVLTELPKPKRGRPPKYDWETWLDGQVRRLDHATDFPNVKDAHTFRMMAYTAARRAGTSVHAHVENDNTLVIQQY